MSEKKSTLSIIEKFAYKLSKKTNTSVDQISKNQNEYIIVLSEKQEEIKVVGFNGNV